MILGILFDFGGVLLTGNLDSFFAKAAPVVGARKERLSFEPPSMVPDFAKGNMDVRDCFEHVFHQKLSEEQFKKVLAIFSTNWQPDKTMFALVRTLKQQGYKLGVLSNSDPINSPIFKEKGLYNQFDAVTLSHEVHAAKPEPEIYEIAVHRLGTPKDKTLFIDDLAVCVAGARKAGIHAIQFTGKEKLVKDLAAFGIHP
ncbi:HAD family phosphatase [Candidatus Woesearchaeota archaeon]|nr:HAD family phosphatase [Candidatus Woesearchaeota archaeon]